VNRDKTEVTSAHICIPYEIVYLSFPTRRMVDGGRPLVSEIFGVGTYGTPYISVSTLHFIWYRLQDTAEYWSDFRGKSLNSSPQNLVPKTIYHLSVLLYKNISIS